MEGDGSNSAGGGRHGGAVDTTRVLNLFGYVGPVASLMTASLYPHHHGHGHHSAAAAAAGRPAAAGGTQQLQRVPSVGDGRSGFARGAHHAHHAAHDGANGRTRFVLSHTEDAIDSVLPCAAERMFKRPGRFGNVAALKFTYHG